TFPLVSSRLGYITRIIKDFGYCADMITESRLSSCNIWILLKFAKIICVDLYARVSLGHVRVTKYFI
ncbi:MAG: hypothetical protein WB975_04885, partial [Nitrososphaeraceae archaeon]